MLEYKFRSTSSSPVWVDFGSGNGFGINGCIDKRGKGWIGKILVGGGVNDVLFQ